MADNIQSKLHIIHLKLPKEGFHHFLCSWIYKGDDAVILVDPGPRSTMPELLRVLEEMKIPHIDHILLTHIHLDHAGGLGKLVERYPEAEVVCHPKGFQHLFNPSKLWQASKKVLYETAMLYEEPLPVPKDRLEFRSDFRAGNLKVNAYETPGHAPHHLCFRIGDMLFVGEAAGIFYPMEKSLYLRIASPQGFDHRDYRKSLDILKNIDASLICYGHWGMSGEVRKLLDMALAQADLWAEVIVELSNLESPSFEEKVFEALLARDAGLSSFYELPADVRKRETYFLGNSFRGFRHSLEKWGYKKTL
ncbi:MAG: MBL fold metallo-hydrolase [Syntrophales bacterium]|nr:MBL fold metallo-hydrolase [Syntrophales bacterium]